jgi:hypothetical protein
MLNSDIQSQMLLGLLLNLEGHFSSTIYHEHGSRGSSVSTVTDYGLDDRISIPDGGRRFFF